MRCSTRYLVRTTLKVYVHGCDGELYLLFFRYRIKACLVGPCQSTCHLFTSISTTVPEAISDESVQEVRVPLGEEVELRCHTSLWSPVTYGWRRHMGNLPKGAAMQGV